MKNRRVILAAIFLLFIGCVVGWIARGRISDEISPQPALNPLYKLIGNSTESEGFKRLASMLDLHVINQDQYVFLPMIWTYREIHEAGDGEHGKAIYFTSKSMPIVLKAREVEHGRQTITEIHLGQYNISGEKIFIDSNFLELLDSKIRSSGFYIPYDFLLVGGIEDAKKFLFHPYATIVEESHAEGASITQPRTGVTMKYPITIWHESGKVYSITFF